MGLITEQTRIEAYRNAEESIRLLYESEVLSEHISKQYTHLGVTQPIRAMTEIVGDTILGFYKTTDLPRLFQQKLNLSADEAQRLTSGLAEFLKPVVHRETVEAEAKRLNMSELASKLQNPSPDRLVNPDIETATENVTPLRTMEKDMSRIHGYGAYRAQEREADGEEDAPEEVVVKSSQEDILPRKPSNLS